MSHKHIPRLYQWQQICFTSTEKLHNALLIGKEKLNSAFSKLLYCVSRLLYSSTVRPRVCSVCRYCSQLTVLFNHHLLPLLPPPQNCLQSPRCLPGPHHLLLLYPIEDDFLALVLLHELPAVIGWRERKEEKRRKELQKIHTHSRKQNKTKKGHATQNWQLKFCFQKYGTFPLTRCF